MLLVVCATVQLIAFPYAGASSLCYKKLGQALPEFVKLVPHEYPGHGSRLREPLHRRLPDLVEDAVARLNPLLQPPYAFYGHSFGAWLARDVSRRLIELARPPALGLFVSGRRAPRSNGTGQLMHRMTPGALVARLAGWGGIPRPVLQDPDMMAMFERILRADFEALETCEQRPLPPLDVPIHVMLGRDDDITPEQARDWQLETLRPLSLSYFPGGHFFINDRAPELAALIGAALSGVTAPRTERQFGDSPE